MVRAPPRHRGTAIGIAISGIAMGSIVFPPIISHLLAWFDWRLAFQLFALLFLAVSLPAALLVVDSPAKRVLQPDGASLDPAGDARPGASGRTAGASVKTILTDPAFWIASAIFTAVLSGIKGMVTNLAPMAIDQGITPISAVSLISIYGACGFLAKLSFAAIADWISSRALLYLSLIGFAGGMACLTQAWHGYLTIATGVGLTGIGVGLMVPLQSYLVPHIFGAHYVGRAMGLMTMAMLVALLTTPPRFGKVYDLTGSYASIFLVFIALTLLAMIAVPFLRLREVVKAASPLTLPGPLVGMS